MATDQDTARSSRTQRLLAAHRALDDVYGGDLRNSPVLFLDTNASTVQLAALLRARIQDLDRIVGVVTSLGAGEGDVGGDLADIVYNAMGELRVLGDAVLKRLEEADATSGGERFAPTSDSPERSDKGIRIVDQATQDELARCAAIAASTKSFRDRGDTMGTEYSAALLGELVGRLDALYRASFVPDPQG